MIRLLTLLACLFLAAPSASGQHPTLPDFCTVPDPLSVAANQVRTISGTPTAACLKVDGTLILADDTKLRVATLHVRAGGTLRCASPTCTGVELTIRDVPSTDTNADPIYGQRVTVGLLGEGKVTLAGSPVTGFVRLALEPQVGATTLSFAEAVSGWQVGDQLIIPDSREDPNRQNDAQLERRTVVSIASDRLSVTLNAPLSFRHPGARNQTIATVLLPHVMNVSRRVVIRSENPTGTRGHVLFTGRADVDIRHVEFRDLGRTTIEPLSANANPAGRYALHFHHMTGPTATPTNGYQFTAIGNALHDTNTARSRIKWPLGIHNSHYGLVQGNVIYNAGGAGIVTEDGNESFNVIDRNMVARVTGNGDRNGHKEGGVQEPGSQGVGFWFHGPNNYVRNNVAANATENTDEAAYGFEIYQEFVGDIRIPNFKGASTHMAGQYTTRSVYELPLLEFSGNEAYGNPQGLTYWWLGMEFHATHTTSESIFRDTTIWHTSRYPVYGYQGAKVTFDGLFVYGDVTNSGECCRRIWWSDYLTRELTIRRATVVGIASLTLPYAVQGTTIIEDSTITTLGGIVNVTSGAPGDCAGCSFPNRRQLLRNVRFEALPGRPLRSITMEHNTHDGHADFVSSDDTFVINYQDQPGNDFRVYYRERPAPCTATRPEIVGFVCGATEPPPPVNCVVSPFAFVSASAWTPAVCPAPPNSQQTRNELWRRTILTHPANGGTACPALDETRVATQSCVPPATSIIVAGIIATEPVAIPTPGGITMYQFFVNTVHGGVLFHFPGLRIPGADRDIKMGDFVNFEVALNPTVK